MLFIYSAKEYEPVISRPFAMAQPEQLHWTSSYVDAPQVVGKGFSWSVFSGFKRVSCLMNVIDQLIDSQ